MSRRIGAGLVNTAAFGAGDRTIVGVGGWVGNWELWQQPFDRLRRTSRVIAYDHPGAGETDVALDHLTFGLRADHPGTMSSSVDLCIPEPDSDHLERWLLRILLRSDAATAIALLEAMYGIDLRPRLPEIDVPVLVVNGELDALPANRVERAEETAELLPDARLHVGAGAGHLPTLTRPGEVAAAIETFLADLGRAGS